MKKIMQICLLSAVLAGFGMAGVAAEQRIATFNLRKAFESYYKTIQSTAGMKSEYAEVEKERAQMIEGARKHEEEWRKLFEKKDDQALSPEEREKSRKAAADKYAELEGDKKYIDQFDQTAAARLREKERIRIGDIVKEIQGVVEARAKVAGYSLVLDSSGVNLAQTPIVLYSDGKDDMTDAIIKELNAAAPPGSLDTNGLAVPLSTNLFSTNKLSK